MLGVLKRTVSFEHDSTYMFKLMSIKENNYNFMPKKIAYLDKVTYIKK